VSENHAPTPAEVAQQPWARLVAHLMWESAARLTLRGDAQLKASSLTLAGVGVLDHIGTWPGISVAEISHVMPKTQQTISQVATRLEKLGYIERRLRPGRGVGLHLTDDGERVWKEASAQEAQLDAQLRESLGSDRYEQLLSLLEQTRTVLTDD
jgi:DNA-binding MarR family transcriptional regulator